MIKIDKKVAYTLASELLKTAGEEFSNHGCNDFEIPSSSRYVEFVQEMYRQQGIDEDDMPEIDEEEKTIDTYDWMVMSFLAAYFKEQAEKL